MQNMYGCYNRPPLKDAAQVQTGWQLDPYEHKYAVAVIATIPVPTTKECQYTLSDYGAVDTRCVGCKWKLEAVRG